MFYILNNIAKIFIQISHDYLKNRNILNVYTFLNFNLFILTK